MKTNKNEDKSGFFDLPKDKTCKNPQHNPPEFIYIPQGKGYRHVCPGCGKITTMISQRISWSKKGQSPSQNISYSFYSHLKEAGMFNRHIASCNSLDKINSITNEYESK